MEKVTFIYPPGSLSDRRDLQVKRWEAEMLLDLPEFDEPNGILHIGCGDGAWAERVVKQFPKNVVVGLDPSNANINQAKQLDYPNLYFVQGDVHFLPFEAQRSDWVCIQFLLASAIDPFQILTEARRVLKPQGRIWIQEDQMLLDQIFPECPQFESVWRKISVLQQEFRQDPSVGKKLPAMLKDAGFGQVQATLQSKAFVEGGPGFKSWVYCLRDNLSRLASSLKASGLCNEGQISQADRELEELLRQKGALVSASWIRVTAQNVPRSATQ